MLRKFSDIKGFSLAALDGEIGKLKELYFDDQSWTVRYGVVETGNWLVGRQVLISPTAFGIINEESKLIAVHLTKQQIEDSPPIEADKPVSRQHEDRFYRYYGYSPYWLGSDTAALAGSPVFAPPPIVYEDPAVEEPSGDPHLRSIGEVTGYSIHASDGDIGKIDDFMIDEDGWSIRYVAISKSWWPSKKVILSPDWIDRVSWEDMQVFVPLGRDIIKEAPAWDDDAPISREYEEQLFNYYGRHGYWLIGV